MTIKASSSPWRSSWLLTIYWSIDAWFFDTTRFWSKLIIENNNLLENFFCVISASRTKTQNPLGRFAILEEGRMATEQPCRQDGQKEDEEVAGGHAVEEDLAPIDSKSRRTPLRKKWGSANNHEKLKEIETRVMFNKIKR